MSGGYTDKRSMLWLLKTRNYTYLDVKITIVEHKFREKRDESKFNVNFPYAICIYISQLVRIC